MNRLFLYLIITILLTNCSFVQKEKSNNKTKKITIFQKDEPVSNELNSSLKIQLNKSYTTYTFINNYTRNNGNIDSEFIFSKKQKFKFKELNQFELTQPEILLTRDNSILFFDVKGSIFKLNKDLKQIWKVNHYSKKEKKMKPILYFAQDNNNLLVADTLSKIYSLNLSNGNLNWTTKNYSPFNSNLVVFKNTLIVVDFENTIRAFDKSNGIEKWNFKSENSFIKSTKKLSTLLIGEVVYFISNLGDITALNANDGSLAWQTPTQGDDVYLTSFKLRNSDIVFANDTIYFSNNKNEFFSIDARSGITKWKQTINSSLRPTIVDNLIFSVSDNGFLFVIDDHTGNIIRVTNLLKNIKKKKNKIKPTGFIISKNKMYVSLNNGKLVKFDIETGIIEKIYKITNSEIKRPFVMNNNIYFVKSKSIIKSN